MQDMNRCLHGISVRWGFNHWAIAVDLPASWLQPGSVSVGGIWGREPVFASFCVPFKNNKNTPLLFFFFSFDRVSKIIHNSLQAIQVLHSWGCIFTLGIKMPVGTAARLLWFHVWLQLLTPTFCSCWPWMASGMAQVVGFLSLEVSLEFWNFDFDPVQS